MTNRADPVTALTPSEEEMVAKLQKKYNRKQLLQMLKDNLQVAVEIELATIPIYLYTYYSIQRTTTTAQQLTPASQFANQAAGIFMSVAVEEMLHMSLSSNVLYSLGVEPQLYGKSPAHYATPLPYHNPVGPAGPDGDRKVLIPIAKFGFEQLWHFLQIEYPETVDAWPEDKNWATIGQFYSYIRCLIHCNEIKDTDFQVGAQNTQIQSSNYSQNNIDTAYPDKPFNPWNLPPGEGNCPAQYDDYPSAAATTQFPNQADSHAGKTELVTVCDKHTALIAIDTICDQGEGFQHLATDDPSGHEYSHYYKFLRLQAQLEDYNCKAEQLPDLPKPPRPIKPTVTNTELAEVIINFPTNPMTRPVGYVGDNYIYPEKYRALSDFCNGVYQYMLILTETVYRVPAGQQTLFFNEGMHRSMIWVLDKLIQAMRNIDLGDGHKLAPTFENIDLGPRKYAYYKLISLYYAIEPDQQSLVSGIMETATTLPDVSPYWDTDASI